MSALSLWHCGDRVVTDITFVNRLPLECRLSRNGETVGAIAPLQSVTQSTGVGESWDVSGAAAGLSVKSLTVRDEGDETCVVALADVLSAPPGASAAMRFTNSTDYTVDLYSVTRAGTERLTATLEPSEKKELARDVSPAIIARALVTQELVSVHLYPRRQAERSNAPIELDHEITDDFRQACRAQSQPRRADWPGGDDLKLVEGPKALEPPQSRLYIHKSVHKLPIHGQFNTLPDVAPQRIRLSGVTLIWDRTDDQYGLMSLQGEDRLNLKALEMYADRVVIRSPLWFPRTDVTIYARELVFEGEGGIKTTPQAFAAAASSPHRTDDGHPADEARKPTYRTADGGHGEKAGDIRLFVKTLTQDRPAVRFVGRGSDGQKAEAGGVKRYERPDDRSEYADADPHLRPVKVDDIKSFIKDKYVVKEPSEWRWPGEKDGPEHAVIDGDVLNLGQVTNLKLIALDERTFINSMSCAFLPSKDFSWSADPTVEVRQDNYRRKDPRRQRPGDGPDAYPAGQPGDGGDGAVVTGLSGVSLEGLCDLAPGQSPPSAAVPGGAPGTPSPAYWLTILIVYKSFIEAGKKPYAEREEVSARPGKDAAGRRGADGRAGRVERITDPGLAWAHPSRPLALEAVVGYARDAFRNGHRDEARAVLEPYLAAIVQEERAGRKLATAIAALRSEIAAMCANMANNLDYHGHALGWLPRLNVKSSYELWEGERQSASKLLYYAAQIEAEWEDLEDRQQTLTATSQALRGEIDVALKELPKAYERLAAAQKAFHDVTEAYKKQKSEIAKLRGDAVDKAKDSLQEQRVFRAFCNIAGGLMEAIPVGQPFVGLAGKTIGVVGAFEWDQSDPMAGFTKGLDDLGETASTFLTENRKILVGKGSDRLREQIRDASSAIDTLETSVAKHQANVDKAWESLRAEELRKLEHHLAAAKTQEKKLKLEGELKTLKGSKQMGAIRDHLEAQIADLKSADEADEREHKRDLLKQISELTARKGDLEENVKTYKSDIARREEKTGDVLDSLKGLGEGIARISQGIAALSAPYDEGEVDRIADAHLKKSASYGKYLACLDELKALNRTKARAVSDLAASFSAIGNYAGQIQQNLGELVALSDQRQAADDALDAGAQQYLQRIQKRARERLLWYQYNFAKAFEYETLQDPGADFLNLDNWVERLREQKRKLAQIKQGQPVQLSAADFEQVEKIVVESQLLELAKVVVTQRLKFAERTSLFFPALGPEQRDTLLREGRVSFRLPDLEVGTYADVRAKIVNIALKTFEIEPDNRHGPRAALSAASDDPPDPGDDRDEESKRNSLILELEFRHSGESIVRDRDGACYYFQCARDEAPISWGFTYNGRNDKKITADKPIETTNVTFGGAKIEYREYYPSLFGEITLWINRNRHKDPAKLKETLAAIGAIKEVALEVEVVRAPTQRRA
jgi:hypothetical protein